ncbi:unnamed protein product [Cuscuta epithymum]|uniref:Uncharacterized protein n=1 Tax=Cuscuta epithymum TaxID=186058 RepID=A0AAV0CNS8_9ASTE|nr:unnamed protein product [Cuscuta epithymum]
MATQREHPHPGPIKRSVLVMKPGEHRADNVWKTEESRDLKLRCITYPKSAKDDGERDPRVVQLLRTSGFQGAERVVQIKIDHGLITALVERWRPETHSFHLPFGEVGITLQDVQVLLGLPIDGLPLTGPTAHSKTEWVQMCDDYLGFRPFEKDIISSNSIRNLAIQRFLLSPWSTDIEVIQHTKTLIWQLLSGLLFPSTSGRASLYFLELLHDNVENLTRWSWGSAVLAFLYHNLCEAAKADTSSIGGCLILLQLWAWERLLVVRPQRVLPLHAIFDLPYGARWACAHNWADSSRFTLRIYRDQFDRLSESEFEWTPYPLTSLLAFCTHAFDLWATKAPLIYCSYFEAYYPGRFCRQFGAVQDIPRSVTHNDRHHATRPENNAEFITEWEQFITEWEQPIYVGRVYDTFEELKQDVSLVNLKEFRTFRNEAKRIDYWRAKCVHHETCAWFIQASLIKHTTQWKVKQYQPKHNCIPNYTQGKNDKLLTSKLIASEISSKIFVKPDYSVKLIMHDIQRKFNIHVGYKKAWYARILALEKRFGNWEAAYNDLPKLLQGMAFSNPGTIVDLRTDQTDTQGTYEFKYAFWSIKAAIDGFNHCLPVISIDGTHLYGKYKGTLLVAVAMNANREIFPLAFGVVDSENGDSWTWFLQLVATNIIPPRRNVCIISDRHVAIDCAFRNVPQLGTPLIQRRYCLRHIRSNFMSQFRSKNLKKLCWRAGSTPILNEFTNYMQQIRGANERAFNYLDAIPKEKWALCFDGGCRYGILTTNLSESFNHALKGCRTLPITALVRATFDKSVQLFVERRNAGMMWNQSGYQFLEKIRKQIMDGWQQRRHTVVIPHNYHSGVFSVAIENATPVTVDFSRSDCDCGCWRMN